MTLFEVKNLGFNFKFKFKLSLKILSLKFKVLNLKLNSRLLLYFFHTGSFQTRIHSAKQVIWNHTEISILA